MDKEAFEYCKSKGLMMINSRSWLGEYAQELFEFLTNPQHEDIVAKCDYYMQLLRDRGFLQSHLMNEVMKIKYSQPLISQGWKNQRHVHYELNNELYYIDWIMYDTNDVPYICVIILENELKEQNIKLFIDDEYKTLKRVYQYYNNGQDTMWMIFNQNGQITKNI